MSAQPLLQLELPGIKKIKSGKVREIFDLGHAVLLVASDRISAFDVIMPNGIPRKGEVLTQISHFWFEKFAALVPNHLLAGELANLASWTGGSAWVASAAPLRDYVVREIVEELRHQYVIAIDAGTAPGWHPLTVKLRNSNLTAHARSGYIVGVRTRVSD